MGTSTLVPELGGGRGVTQARARPPLQLAQGSEGPRRGVRAGPGDGPEQPASSQSFFEAPTSSERFSECRVLCYKYLMFLTIKIPHTHHVPNLSKTRSLGRPAGFKALQCPGVHTHPGGRRLSRSGGRRQNRQEGAAGPASQGCGPPCAGPGGVQGCWAGGRGPQCLGRGLLCWGAWSTVPGAGPACRGPGPRCLGRGLLCWGRGPWCLGRGLLAGGVVHSAWGGACCAGGLVHGAWGGACCAGGPGPRCLGRGLLAGGLVLGAWGGACCAGGVVHGAWGGACLQGGWSLVPGAGPACWGAWSTVPGVHSTASAVLRGSAVP